jgi:CRISPR-associated protein Cas1
LKVKEHFDNKLNYCILNPQGRKIFIKAFEERLEKKFKHGKLKRLVSYNTAIKIDGYKLIKDIMEDKPFIPFIEKVKI